MRYCNIKCYALMFMFSSLMSLGCESCETLHEPSDLTATTINRLQIKLTWRDNSNSEESFLIERRNDRNEFREIAIVVANNTEFTDTGLNSNTTYDYRVQAVNDYEHSDFSNVASARTGAPMPAPTNLTANTINRLQIRLDWRDNSTDEESFNIERSLDGSGFTEVAVVLNNITDYTDPRLNPNTTYYYRVQAVNDLEKSGYTNVASSRTGPPMPPPSNLTATVLSASQIKLTWQDNSTDEESFEIERSLDGNTFGKIAIVVTNITEYTDTGLTANVTYYYRVRAVNDFENSAYSNTASARP